MKNLAGNEKIGAFQILILILSVIVLLSLLIDTFFKLPPDVSYILNRADDFICIIFLIDFLYRLNNASDKWKFMRWGWIDLVASIPMLDIARAGRILRIIRVLRIIRAYRSTKYLVDHIFQNRIKGTFSTAALISILLIIFSSVSILILEKDLPDANIKTGEDALWWSFVTITTVGYGDKFPISGEGKIIAAVLMVGGVGLFGIFTGFIATWFMSKQPEVPVINASETPDSTAVDNKEGI